MNPPFELCNKNPPNGGFYSLKTIDCIQKTMLNPSHRLDFVFLFLFYPHFTAELHLVSTAKHA